MPKTMAVDTSAPLASAAIPSNTLTLTNLEHHHFDSPEVLDALRVRTAAFGPICFFSPIRTFRRIFVVYESTFDAQRAKAVLHNTPLDATTNLRVYFGSNTELSVDSEKYYLHLPEVKTTTTTTAESNPCTVTGLHSPPGSPPLHHVEMDDDEEMTVLELPALSTSPTLDNMVLSPSSASTPPSSSLATKFSAKLRIDTQPLSTSKDNGQRRSPVSPSSQNGGLYPSTPTLLAFSPAQDSKGEQPFITIQDWAQCC
ncbi:hypothetical protein BGZ83_003940 [Gryganskiella cystojenkinii]|nr:hypothetical protein BGZ83_003940 [Gryganskiella cystojenkinii]